MKPTDYKIDLSLFLCGPQGKWSYVANFYSLSLLKNIVIYMQGLCFVLMFSVYVKLKGNCTLSCQQNGKNLNLSINLYLKKIINSLQFCRTEQVQESEYHEKLFLQRIQEQVKL